MFGDVTNGVVTSNLPFFVPSELFWGMGLIVLSIIFSFFIWRQKLGFSAKGIAYWILDLAVFIFALLKISAAFPRLPFGVTFGVLFVLVIVAAGSTVVVSKKEDSKADGKSAGGAESK